MKGTNMKRITMISLLLSGLILLTGLAVVAPGFTPLTEVQAPQASPDHVLKHVFTLDVAVDCRTFVSGPNRGDVFIINGKLFPAGTLPSGTASNDPTEPVNGIAPIGDWLVRGQHAFPFPVSVAPAYSSTPGDFATQYYILNDGRALTAEGYAYLPSESRLLEAHLSVTGGIGGFRGAAGDLEGIFLGTNATGCPNSTVKFKIVRRSMGRASND
jgi:hypothetical protein